MKKREEKKNIARLAREFCIFSPCTCIWNISFVFSPKEMKGPNLKSAADDQFSIPPRSTHIINSILISGQLVGRRTLQFILLDIVFHSRK